MQLRCVRSQARGSSKGVGGAPCKRCGHEVDMCAQMFATAAVVLLLSPPLPSPPAPELGSGSQKTPADAFEVWGEGRETGVCKTTRVAVWAYAGGPNVEIPQRRENSYSRNSIGSAPKSLSGIGPPKLKKKKAPPSVFVTCRLPAPVG